MVNEQRSLNLGGMGIDYIGLWLGKGFINPYSIDLIVGQIVGQDIGLSKL